MYISVFIDHFGWFTLSFLSSARVPISRGIRSRKYTVTNYACPEMSFPSILAADDTANSTNNVQNHHNHNNQQLHQRRHQSSAPLSDEGDTSEYSRPASTSEHSTLESNPDMSARVHNHKHHMAPPQIGDDGYTSSSTSSSSSSDDEDNDATAKSTRAYSTGASNSARGSTRKVTNNNKCRIGGNIKHNSSIDQSIATTSK